MAALNKHVKLYIIQRLACFDTPTEVAEAVKEEFDIILDRSHVGSYDPTTNKGRELGVKLKTIFFESRKKFLDDINKIPIASQSFRLRALQRSHDFFTQRKNFIAANAVLVQAAKEVGGFYTNKMKVNGDANNQLMLFLEQINGSSMPIVENVEVEF